MATTSGILTTRTILVIDDSRIVLDSVSQALTQAGYLVLTLDNPLVAPNVVRREQIDLVLIDLNMPAVAGDVVAKILVHAGVPGSRVVLYSGIEERELEARAKACGAAGFIQKLSDEHLVAEVARFIRGY